MPDSSAAGTGERGRRTIRLDLSPQAERYARPDAPREARLLAARGVLPLPALELATVLFALVHDPDPEVKSRARDSLESLPPHVLEPVLSGPAHPALLSHLADAHRDDETALERIALNAATDDSTIARLAALPVRRVVEIVSNNQERMLRCPEIVDALGGNPLTGRAVIDRIHSFLGVGEDDDGDGADETGEVSEAAALAALRAVLGDDLGEAARSLVEESGSEAPDLAGDPADSSLYALIQTLSVFQKVKLARVGNKEARGLLVRDRNKVVATAAILSPKVTDNEVISYAQSRNLSEEVIRIIANNRSWTRSYPVQRALVTNPRCPLPTSLRFVGHLRDNDLRNIMRSKDVHANVALAARRALMKKGKL